MAGTATEQSDEGGVPAAELGLDHPGVDDAPDAEIERGTVRTNGVDTYYERRGEGAPVVFVHGAIMDHRMWGPQFDALADEFTVVTYDVRGHGHTNGSCREHYSIDLFADDLALLVEGLDLDRPVVCGASMGGAIAQSYAVRHPEKLSGLVLSDSFTPAVLDWRDRMQMRSLTGAVWPVKIFGIRRVQALMTWAQERFVDPGSRGDYETVARLQAEAPAIPPSEFAKVVRATARFIHEDLDLESIAVPTLVFYGEHTVGTIRRHVPAFESRVPDVEVREVPVTEFAAVARAD
jgi:pimeloyl-ACP methyl ester carboxylesterase